MSAVSLRSPRRLVAWLLAALLVIAGAVVAADSAHADVVTDDGSISGIVTDETGAPLGNVRVKAFTTASPFTIAAGVMTDDSGAYQLGGLADGDYLVQFDDALRGATAFVSEWWDDASSRETATAISVAGGEQLAGFSPVLAAGGAIGGTVTDPTGAAVAYAYLSIWRYDAGTGQPTFYDTRTTDGNGSFTIGGLPAGQFTVEVHPQSYDLLGEWWKDAVDQASATPIAVTATATSAIDIHLDAAGVISGTLTDEQGMPVANVGIYALPTSGGGGTMTSTDGNGVYRLSGLRPGGYKLQFTTDQASVDALGEWWDGAADAASAAVVTVVGGETTSAVDATLRSAGGIAGVVTDGDGAPLADVSVIAYAPSETNSAAQAFTGEDGSYRLRGLAAGDYVLQFSQYADGQALFEWWNNAATRADAAPVTVAPASVVEGIDVTLAESDGSVRETYDASLCGRVVDGLGRPIEGASVSVESIDEPSGDGFATDANGEWSYGDLAAGRYVVSFSAVIDGQPVTQWWDGAATRESATPIVLGRGEQRTGIDATLGTAALPLLKSATPKIKGTPRVGSLLTTIPGTWTSGTQFTYQWLADGNAIDGATAPTFVPTPAQLKKRITVAVTGSQGGYGSVTEVSKRTSPVVRGKLQSAKPEITGRATVGATVTAHAGAWTAGTELTYRWLAGGVPIPGARKASFTVGAAQVGKSLRVVITGRLSGYLPDTRTSGATTRIDRAR